MKFLIVAVVLPLFVGIVLVSAMFGGLTMSGSVSSGAGVLGTVVAGNESSGWTSFINHFHPAQSK